MQSSYEWQVFHSQLDMSCLYHGFHFPGGSVPRGGGERAGRVGRGPTEGNVSLQLTRTRLGV